MNVVHINWVWSRKCLFHYADVRFRNSWRSITSLEYYFFSHVVAEDNEFLVANCRHENTCFFSVDEKMVRLFVWQHGVFCIFANQSIANSHKCSLEVLIWENIVLHRFRGIFIIKHRNLLLEFLKVKCALEIQKERRSNYSRILNINVIGQFKTFKIISC